MPNIASRVSQLTGEGALAVFTRVKELEKEGWSIIHLELGEPDFIPLPKALERIRGGPLHWRAATRTTTPRASMET